MLGTRARGDCPIEVTGITPPASPGSETPARPAIAPPGADPELLALPAAPRGRRFLSIALLCSVIVGASALLLHLRADLAYSFAAERTLDIGEASSAELAALVPNRYVRVRGAPMLSRAVRYERPFAGRAFAIFPLAGQRQIFVQLPVAALDDPGRIARGEFTGRLMTFDQLGARMRTVRDYLADALGMPVTAESFVVLAEEPPAAYRWVRWLSLGCGLMIAFSGWLLWRWFRPQPSATPATETGLHARTSSPPA
jgi:hypothetical protein